MPLSPFRLTAVLGLAAMSACSAVEEAAPAPAAAPAFGWTVNGVAVTTTNLQSQKFGATIAVSGTVNPGSAVSSRVLLEMPPAVGTYSFTPSSVAAATYSASSGNSAAVYYAGANAAAGTVTGSGSIVVTAITATSVTGTFSFVGVDAATGTSRPVSKGQFTVGL